MNILSSAICFASEPDVISRQSLNVWGFNGYVVVPTVMFKHMGYSVKLWQHDVALLS